MQSAFDSEEVQTYRMLITDFYEAHETHGLSQSSDPRKVAEVVLNAFGSAHGVVFGLSNIYQLKRKNGSGDLPSAVSGGLNLRYECRQRMRIFPTPKVHWSKTRHRRRVIERFDCKGKCSIYFPNSQSQSDVFAIEYEHKLHEGYMHYGVPTAVRSWIHDNPQPSPLLQREALLSAIRKGEISGIEETHYLSSVNINYWWRKGVAKDIYISNDSWENAAHYLRNHEIVYPFFEDFSDYGRQAMLNSILNHGSISYGLYMRSIRPICPKCARSSSTLLIIHRKHLHIYIAL